jgi:hypothetical protein
MCLSPDGDGHPEGTRGSARALAGVAFGEWTLGSDYRSHGTGIRGADCCGLVHARHLETLGPAEGTPVYAVIKTVGFDRQTLGAACRPPNGADTTTVPI